MDTSIPDDAENVQYNFVTWQGSSFDLRFDYPPDKIPGFLAKTCFSSLDSLQDNYMMFANDWWHPDEASTNGRIWVGGECAHHGGVFVWIVIDVTNPLEYSIYMSGGVS